MALEQSGRWSHVWHCFSSNQPRIKHKAFIMRRHYDRRREHRFVSSPGAEREKLWGFKQCWALWQLKSQKKDLPQQTAAYIKFGVIMCVNEIISNREKNIYICSGEVSPQNYHLKGSLNYTEQMHSPKKRKQKKMKQKTAKVNLAKRKA